MIKLKESSNKDEIFLKDFNMKPRDEVYIITLNDKNVGVIMYYKSTDVINIEYISVLDEYRRKGIATEVIGIINPDGYFAISGNSLPHDDSVGFWKSLDADFEGLDEEIEYYREENACIPFFIH